MRPLTDRTPKPLLKVGDTPLIVHLIEALVRDGYSELVINCAHLGAALQAALGTGAQFGAHIQYSPEPREALETGGGILNALPLLGKEPFAVVNGDLWTDYPFGRLPTRPAGLAHLVLVDNPLHRKDGDFALSHGKISNGKKPRLTFAGIGVYCPRLFHGCAPGRFPLAPVLRRAAARGEVSGEHYPGQWFDVGTPERLREVNRILLGAPRN